MASCVFLFAVLTHNLSRNVPLDLYTGAKKHFKDILSPILGTLVTHICGLLDPLFVKQPERL